MPRIGTRRRAVLSLIAAVVFGLFAALLKGQANGLRDAVGNLSSPWLLVAFGCGCLDRSRARGAALGFTATVLALAGFCLGLALISDYGTTSAAVSVHLAFTANTRYFEAGLISGPLLGAFGATCTRHAANRIFFAGVLLLAEPITAVAAHRFAMLNGLTGQWSGFRSTAYLLEGICGVLVVSAALLRPQRPTSSAT